MQAAGDLVAAAVAELAAGVQHGQHDLGGGALLLLVHVDGDAAAVVGDRDAVVRVQHDLDRVAVAGERLVDGVVDDLVDQVVEAALAGRADVHAGSLADRLEAFEDGDVGGLVARAGPLARRPSSSGHRLPGRPLRDPFSGKKTSESRLDRRPGRSRARRSKSDLRAPGGHPSQFTMVADRLAIRTPETLKFPIRMGKNALIRYVDTLPRASRRAEPQ